VRLVRCRSCTEFLRVIVRRCSSIHANKSPLAINRPSRHGSRPCSERDILLKCGVWHIGRIKVAGPGLQILEDPVLLLHGVLVSLPSSTLLLVPWIG
jgi:hypothetical protein